MADGHQPPAPNDGSLVVKVSEAKARLSELIARAEAGEHVVIARGDQAAVTLTPVRKLERRFGMLRDEMTAEQITTLEAQLDDLEENGWYTEEELDEFEGDLDGELRKA